MTLAPTLSTAPRPAAAAPQGADRTTGRTPDPAVVPGDRSVWTCLVCAGPAAQPEGCCSATCADLADLELQATSRHLQGRANDLADDAAGAERHRRLAERAGRLSSALLRWRASNDPARCPGLALPRPRSSAPGFDPLRSLTGRRAAHPTTR